MLRSLFLTAAVGLCIAGPALAQPASGVNWTGPYVGVNLGYGGGDFGYPFSGTTDAAGTNPVDGAYHQRSSGIIGGGQAGYNFEMPNGVIAGIEADIDGTGIHGANGFTSATAAGTSSGGTRSDLDYLGTVRGRLGYALFNGRMVPYVTGGFAYGQVDTNNSINCSACGTGGAAVSNLTSTSDDRTGWTVGGGADYALSPHLSMRLEYLYADLGHGTAANGASEWATPGGDIYGADVGLHTKANLVRIGLNYRF
jgi:outer membrane immunogenic protein